MNKDVELQVWKELATSKQVLMTAVIESLELNPDCTSGDLRLAINLLKERADEAEKRCEFLEEGQVFLNTIIEGKDDEIVLAQTDMHVAESKLLRVQELSAEALLEAKTLVNNKQKELKAINKILSDSPANVVKKMKKMKQKNLEQAKHVKKIEREFSEAVRMCERLRDDIEGRVAEKKELEARINKLTPVKTE